MTSSTRDTENEILRETQRITELIDGHRVRAHRTPSIPEKLSLITTMSELRRARTRLVRSLTESAAGPPASSDL